jgi:hypothetical protein
MTSTQRLVRALRRRLGQAPALPTIPMHYAALARLLYFKRLFDRIADIDGHIVECGVGKGRSLLLLATLAKDEGRGRHLWGFDSFEGFPEPSSHDSSPRNPQKGDWSDTSIVYVLNYLKGSQLDPQFIGAHITLIKGFFNETLLHYRHEPIAFLHLDCDLYGSYKDSLTLLYDKVVPGGVICFDEYMKTGQMLSFPGAARAIDEFFGARRGDIQRDPISGGYFYIKPST